MNVFCYVTKRTALRALMLSAAAAVVAALATPAEAGIIFNPGPGSTGPINISGFSYAPSSALAFGSTAPTPGSSFNIYGESVINGTTGTPSTIGANFSINGSTNEFTAILGLREQIVSNDGTTVKFALTSTPTFSTSTSAPNFFEIFANTAGTVNPSTGNGTGFGAGTPILTGHLTQDNYAGNFTLSSSPSTGPFVQPNGLSVAPNTTTSSIIGTGSTQFTVVVDTFNPAFFPVNPGALLFSTTNSLPFASVAPLSGFYSGNTTSPDINWAASPTGLQFNTGTTNGVNGQSTMFQTVATSNFAIPEPASMIQLATAALLIPSFVAFRRRRANKTGV